MSNAPARILHVFDCATIAGGTLAQLGLISHLDRRRFEPIALVPTDGPIVAEIRRRDVEVVLLDVIRFAAAAPRLEQLALLARCWNRLRKGNYRLLHAYSPMSYRLPSLAGRRMRLPRICHLQFPHPLVELELNFRVPPQAVVSCSASMRRDYEATLARMCPQAIVRTVLNCADLDRNAPGPPSEELRRELRLTAGTPVVTIVGQVSRRKGHPDFLRMAQRTRATLPQCRFLIAGNDLEFGGRFEDEMRALAQELGVGESVAFLGHRRDVPDVVRASDVIVLASSAEGLPLSLAEAAACGKPAVVYDVPGVDEIVLDGRNGFRVPYGDVEALSAAVTRLLTDAPLRAEMGVAARELAESRFSLTAHVAAIEGLYDELLGR